MYRNILPTVVSGNPRTLFSRVAAVAVAGVLVAGSSVALAAQVPVAGVTASAHDGNVPANAIDGNLTTRWSAEGDGQWIRFDLGAIGLVNSVAIAWAKGDIRKSFFDVQASLDGTTWTTVLGGAESNGTTLNLQCHVVWPTDPRYVRIVGHGNNDANPASRGWNSITEVKIYDTGNCDSAPPTPQLGAPSAAAVQAAINFSPLVRYHRDLPGGGYSNAGNTGGNTYILAMAARAGNTSADARLLEQIRYTLTGGNDIAANGGYPAQHELQVTGMLSIVKRVPRIWNQLTTTEKAKADTMMKASLVGNAFVTSDNNPFVLAGTQQYTLDGDSNINRVWNPNHREGQAGSILVAAAYFGVAQAKSILQNYNHAAFVSELSSRGLSNGHRTFNWKAANPSSGAPTGTQIQNAVRNWSIWGITFDNPMQIYADLTVHTYGVTRNRRIECGYNNGQGVPASGAPGGVAGVIDSGCAGLPNKGQPGLLMEFDALDASGTRSSALYAYGGFKPNLFTRTVLIDAGMWQPNVTAIPHAVPAGGGFGDWQWPAGANLANYLDVVLVGGADLWYKLDRGYRNYHHGAYRGTLQMNTPGWGFVFLRSLWSDVLGYPN